MLKGIDISNYQVNVDFNALKNAVQVVIIKATEGVSFIDPKLESHYQGAKNAGFPVGFYHFMSEKTSPSEQAVEFYNAIKNKSYEIIPVLDIENNSQNRNASQITDRCLEFLAKFKELSGLDCIIYTGGYFGRDNLDSRIKRYKAWIAHYGVSAPMATGFYNVVGHQYTSNGRVSGINGNVDLNNFTEGIFINNQQTPVEPPRQESNSGNNIIRELQQEFNRQLNSGLVVDGIAGPKTLSAAPLIKQGAQGNITKWIQEKVGTTPDGIFGVNTKQAVINFQKSQGLSADGIVGQNTWRKLLGL